MAYIGNARTLMILGSNVKDDLIPNDTNTFILSQEVPGGYEGNVWVLKKKWNGTEDNSFWEVLEPEIDYRIFGDGEVVNRKIELIGYIPSINDKVYVIHKGDATYNFVPSPKSVGPEQLSENLRDFKTDSFTGNGTTTTFNLTRDVASANSILVTINGIVKSSNTSINQVDGDYLISTNGNQITFNIAPTNNSKIRILHLSFSTISRRASFAPGQEPTIILDNSVTENKISNAAVTKNKIAENSVDGNRILLDNDQSIRSKKLDGTSANILKLSSDNNTTLLSPTNLTKIEGDLSVTGNIEFNNNDILLLKQQFDNLKTSIDDGTLGMNILPIGTILIHSKASVPSEKFLICDGTALNTFTYKDLHSIISNTFGGTAYQLGVTDQPGATTTFNLPDMRNRSVFGQNNLQQNNHGVSDGMVIGARNILHSHSVPSHTHDLSNHTHDIPGHRHNHTLTADGKELITDSKSVDHNHTGTTNIGGAHLHTVKGLTTGAVDKQTLITKDFRHNHQVTGKIIEGGIHTHALKVTGTSNVDHVHDKNDFSSTSRLASKPEGASTENKLYSTVVGEGAHEHDHNIQVGNDNINNDISALLDHCHKIDFKTGSTDYLQTNGGNEGSHSHSFTTNGLVSGTTTSHNHTIQSHSHNISGSIGKIDGNLGDDIITSTNPNINQSGGNSSFNTISNSSPYIVLTFIIKAKK